MAILKIFKCGLKGDQGYGLYDTSAGKILFIFSSLSPLKITLMQKLDLNCAISGIKQVDIRNISNLIEKSDYEFEMCPYTTDMNLIKNDFDALVSKLKMDATNGAVGFKKATKNRHVNSEECFGPYDIGIYIEPLRKDNARKERAGFSIMKNTLELVYRKIGSRSAL